MYKSLRDKAIVFMTAMLVLVMSLTLFAGEGQIPVTTSSNDARQFFLKGQDLFEKLRAVEARRFLTKAIEADPNFALAYAYRANTQFSAATFFDDLNKAVSLADKGSEGERIWIMAAKAGADGNIKGQQELLNQLVSQFPQDERALNLMGNSHFGQQNYQQSIEWYNKAVAVNPDFSQPYNQLGYAHRFLYQYDDAEKAFKKYIALIPGDPNPLDSYAELLMKTGKYRQSIEMYRKALKIDPHFVASFVGIATNHDYLKEYERARAVLDDLLKNARDDGERRTAWFGMATSYIHEDRFDKAVECIEEMMTLAEKIDDKGALAGDLNALGLIYLEAGKYDKAIQMYEQSLQMSNESNSSQGAKDGAARAHLYITGQALALKGDLTTAKAKAKEFQEKVNAANAGAFQKFQIHELYGIIALKEGQYQKAADELKQANLQDPYNHYRLAQAYKGLNNTAEAEKYLKQAVDFNALNGFNQAFVRLKADDFMASL